MTDHIDALISRFDQLLERLDRALPPLPEPTDWRAHAFRWRVRNGRGWLAAVDQPHSIRLSDIANVDAQKDKLVRNTAAFVAGRPANNVLLSGSRGSGKSSLVKALLPAFSAQGLRLVEVDRTHLADLPDIIEQVADRPERFILFCDDLSFEEGDDAYKALKSALDGGISRRCDNLLVYSTSNRRHLLPDRMRDNLDTRSVDGEIHPGEAVEEKVSLSERFGLWLSFYPFSQDEYLAAAEVWLSHFKLKLTKEARQAALLWAQMRGARSGRVAWQFACDWAGRTPAERKQL
ncbi:ATP-binding protein [Microvirgula aerodenitrificans]|uniref:ATP-binding protein n=1 Tax=Microvirgula aerodenitrificans TaxID=57480 RepID=UPI00048C0F62|nr:ATP-binding protein [Microvirgula aerodenitrificans]